MFNPYVIVGIVVFYLGSLFSVALWERNQRDNYWQAKFTKDKLVAVETAIAEERANQEKVNAIATKQTQNLQAVNATLQSQLTWLRQRSASGNPQNPGFIGESASGSIISERDGEFLAGFAARAESVRQGLEACYNYADAIAK